MDWLLRGVGLFLVLAFTLPRPDQLPSITPSASSSSSLHHHHLHQHRHLHHQHTTLFEENANINNNILDPAHPCFDVLREGGHDDSNPHFVLPHHHDHRHTIPYNYCQANYPTRLVHPPVKFLEQ
ncbi:hypothetical protein BC829DRAFT_258176 [Chytridium lagenaria]|nr:hypothetical protein BC829DRAFT_258176 [Chytridium lagenaria]